MTGECKYVQKQQRFKKVNGNVTIIDFDMTFKLRLSRKIAQNGICSMTVPYDDLEELKKDYGNSSARMIYDEKE